MFGDRVGRVLSRGAVAALVVPAALWFHTHLTHSSPSKDETVAAAPTQVRLWFSQKPEVGLTSVTLLAADSSKVPTGKAAKTDDTLSVAVPIEGALQPGSYVVRWRTASKDGHPVKGQYAFTVAAHR